RRREVREDETRVSGAATEAGTLRGLRHFSGTPVSKESDGSERLVVLVPAVEVRALETGDRVLQRQAERDELVAHLVHRLLSEIADVHELRLREGDELADRVDSLAL